MVDRRRVLLVLGPSTGGIRRHVAFLSEGLEARGWEVEVAGPPGVMEGLRHQDYDFTVPRNQHVVGSVRHLARIARRADVVHAHGLTVGWAAALVPRRPPLVLTVHNLVLDQAEGRSAGVLRRLEGRLPGRVDRTIVITDEMARRFSGLLGADHVLLIPPAGPKPTPAREPAEVRAELGVPDGVPLVVLVGRLHPQKDIGSLLDATRMLVERGIELRVAVVGGGDLDAELRAQASGMQLSDVVTFTGARDDAADFLAAADVVVMSSLWEGSPLVISEALQLARPVVSTDVGSVGRMVIDGETGRLVPPSRPNRLADAMADLLTDPGEARRLGEAGARHVAATFGAPALIDRVAAVYVDVMEKR